MVQKSGIYEFVVNKMKSNPDIILGIADISYSDYSKHYKYALVFAVPHKEIISLDNYREEKFEEVVCAARDRASIIISELSSFFQEHNIEYYIPPVAQTDEKSLIAPFSFKFAAVNAGIGWIGKNGVLVTKEYGPRVRLSVILVNCDLPAGEPISQSMCDEKCFICVEACPYGALKGIQWDINKLREELIDYQLCNFKRSLYLQKHNRKNACGICMAACPIGL